MIYNKLVSSFILSVLLASCQRETRWDPIDRHALLERNSPVIEHFDPLESLSVGNGGFAFTVDASGLQTFPEAYSLGVPLGTMSDWGWHAFPNTEHYRFAETFVEEDFGRGHKEIYASQLGSAAEVEAKAKGNKAWKEFCRKKAAIDFFRSNPHRLHLGNLGLYLGNDATFDAFSDVHQRLDLESGIISSEYKLFGEPVSVRTCVHPDIDLVAVHLKAETPKSFVIRLPYPTGGHSDDACCWVDDESLHTTSYKLSANHLVVTHHFPKVEVTNEFDDNMLADFSYKVNIDWDSSKYGEIKVEQIGPNKIVFTPLSAEFAFTAEWMPCHDAKNPYQGEGSRPANMVDYDTAGDVCKTMARAVEYWNRYWHQGAVIDFSHCKAPEAKELERRVVLSQYLLAINCAGQTPPQETGLTYNSWFGKYHMEMIWWHQAQFALLGHPEKLLPSMKWYSEAEPVAREIARRQGFQGVRWMKMTDPSGLEAPSSIGSYLIWQQPHYIYLSELLRRAMKDDVQMQSAMEESAYDLVQKTAAFMCDFAVYDTLSNRYILKGAIPAQETLSAYTSLNSPFELSQWHFALGVANEWRERRGNKKNMEWEELRDKLSPLAFITDSIYSAQYGELYTASEDSDDTYRDLRLTSDHMAVLGAYGIFPKCPLVREDIMRNTLHWVWDNWNWGKTWGWDYPMTAMCAARLGERQMAVDVLLGNNRTNTYLISGHNYQDSTLRLYLPGNGGLLTAVAMMCAGWDGNKAGRNPGFPDDGNWDVRWEGVLPLP